MTSSQTPSTDRRHEHAPFDLIGDVHGCVDELVALLHVLGYEARFEGSGDERRAITSAPKGRRVFFVGDLVDRGPNSPDVLRIVMDMVDAGQALSIAGNHDDKLLRWLKGNKVKIGGGLECTIEQLAGEGDALKSRAR
ncbi:MAG: metallophosphoesterase, partial [Hyphomicrobium sp.]